MTATICPTVTARTVEDYKVQMEQIASFATRIHIDIADGIFTPVKLIGMDHIWWPAGVRADLHVMYEHPFGQGHIKQYLKLKPQMVIVHAEAKGDFIPFAEELHRHGIEVGVALKQETPVSLIRPALDWIDHVLIFSGNLGHYGGQADLTLIMKIKELTGLKPSLEIGWDGGINDRNARALAMSGVDVLNVGGFIHHAGNPQGAYTLLDRQVV